MKKIEKYRLVACVAMAIATLFDPATARSAETASPVGGRELAVEMGAPFHDHAILQRGMKVPVWGWSKPGTKVTVTFVPRPGSGQAGQTKTATAGKDGKWLLHLDPLEANAEPAEMVITEQGGKTETLTDILVGEVWLASGQSNMQYLVCKQDTKVMPKEILARVKEGKETMPMIREVQVPGWGATLRPVEKAKAAWSDDWNNMSAIAFAFAYEIEKELKVPVGIVNCSFSQTPIEGWAHSDGFKGGEDQFTKDIYQSILDKDPARPGFKAAWDAYGTKVREWAKKADELVGPGFRPNPIPEVPGPNPMPELPVDFRFGNRGATWLYNAKTHPMAPYAIRGVIWNQGYHNSNDGFVYRNNLHSLVRSFRSVWSNPELPVYFHQFYSTGFDDDITLNPQAEMRLGTWVASQEIPNVAMASQIDIYGGVHYYYKRLPGQRLAWHALKNQYGKKIIANGPMYKGYTVKGAKLVLELDHADGLCAGKCFPHTHTEPATAKTDGVSVDDVTLFYLADGDLKWHPAKAVIKGSTIELTSATVTKPRGVAYGCKGVGNLPGIYNKAMLPLTPFVYYDHKLVVSPQWKWDYIKIPSAPLDVMVWPMEYFARGDKEVDMTTYGIGYTYKKLPHFCRAGADDHHRAGHHGV
jgi:sialate O-acetylesterase